MKLFIVVIVRNITYIQYYTLWRIPGAVLPSWLVQTVGLLPGAGAGEGVAGSPGSIVPIAATRGQSCLCVAPSDGGKLGEGADPGPIGVEKLHRTVDTATGGSARYEDH